MQLRLTSEELAKDVASAEIQCSLHDEHKAEIDTRMKDFSKFFNMGQRLIAGGHAFASEVEFKILRFHFNALIVCCCTGT
jgi:hypothetical protein